MPLARGNLVSLSKHQFQANISSKSTSSISPRTAMSQPSAFALIKSRTKLQFMIEINSLTSQTLVEDIKLIIDCLLCKTYVNTNTRNTQDSFMLYTCIMITLSNEAQKQVRNCGLVTSFIL
jgi:hypothetical protein